MHKSNTQGPLKMQIIRSPPHIISYGNELFLCIIKFNFKFYYKRACFKYSLDFPYSYLTHTTYGCAYLFWTTLHRRIYSFKVYNLYILYNKTCKIHSICFPWILCPSILKCSFCINLREQYNQGSHQNNVCSVTVLTCRVVLNIMEKEIILGIKHI